MIAHPRERLNTLVGVFCGHGPVLTAGHQAAVDLVRCLPDNRPLNDKDLVRLAAVLARRAADTKPAAYVQEYARMLALLCAALVEVCS